MTQPLSNGNRPWTRRHFIAAGSLVGGSAALGLPGFVAAQASQQPATGASGLADRARDWDWLIGNWDVRHRRLKDRLVGSDQMGRIQRQECVVAHDGGLGNIDDNSFELPGGSYRGLTVRAYDPQSHKWAIWWLDGRNPTHIDPPVLGGFENGTGTFIGRDTFKGRPILMRFIWRETRGPRPWWEQAFSVDEGATWEVNWRNYFTRTAPAPTPLAKLPDAHKDWDFLVGTWNVRHRRLKARLTGNTDWDEFGGTLVNWPVLGGHANVGDNVMQFPTGTVRGVGLRAYDPTSKQWLSWWLDGREPSVISSPLRGGFVDRTGTFTGDDTLNGQPIKTRVVWSQITPRSARWEQSASADGGKTWKTNWTSEFTRR